MARKKKKKPLCRYCNRELKKPTDVSGLAYTKDHIVAKAHGGGKTVPCCKACNSLKGDMTLEQWLEFRQKNPKWWKLYGQPNRKPNLKFDVRNKNQG